MNVSNKTNVIILISGNGSNLQAIMDAATANLLPIEIKAVISSNPSAYGLQRAQNAGINNLYLSPKDYSTRSSYDDSLARLVSEYEPDLILLAGFMRILGSSFLQKFKNKILNIHPSLLPKYPGLNSHELVIKEGAFEHGCSIHFVNEDLDAGPLIAQAVIKVTPDDTIQSLKDRVHKAEHFLYPTVINWFCQHRVQLHHDQVLLDNVPVPNSGMRFILNSL